MDSNRTILLIEDDPSTRKFLMKFLAKLDFEVYVAIDGDDGIYAFDKYHPDIILTDYNMPRKNGIDVIRHIRSRTSTFWFSIIVLSAIDEFSNVINCLEEGANDYITKPVNFDILKAKIETYSNLSSVQKENIRIKKILEESYQKIKNEEVLAEKLFCNILSKNARDEVPICYWLKPASRFSGDLISIEKSVSGETFFILADVTGHGLSASLITLIISQIFHDMVERECSLQEISIKLNNSIYNLVPKNFFAAACIMRIIPNENALEFWFGGLPDILVFDRKGRLIERFSSTKLALGILSPEEFNSEIKRQSWSEPVKILAYSDGLIEAESYDKNKFGEEKLINIMNKNLDSTSLIHEIETDLKSFTSNENFEDDISVLLVDL